MSKLFITVLCLASFVAAQTSSSTTSQQHSTTEKSSQSNTQPTADIETTAGNIHCVLFPNKAPLSVANFSWPVYRNQGMEGSQDRQDDEGCSTL